MKIKDFINYTVDKIVIYKSKDHKEDEYENVYVELEYVDLYEGDPKKVPSKFLDMDIRLVGAKRKGIFGHIRSC